MADDYDWDKLIDQYNARLDDHDEDPFFVEEWIELNERLREYQASQGFPDR